MRKQSVGCVLLFSAIAHAQFGRGVGDWSTTGADAHRSSWVRTDPKISPDNMRKPGFQFLWKMKLESSHTLSTPVLLTGYIGYKGFRSLGYVGGSSDTVHAMDTDLARSEWQKRFPVATREPGSSACAGGMTANVTRAVSAAFPAPPDGRGGGGGGRGGPARSAVGEPGQGAAILAVLEEQARRAAAAPPPPPRPAAPGGPGGGFTRMPNVVYALSSDGMLHAMYVSNGDEPDPPVRFLPANANASGLTVVGGVAYAATTRGCGGAANGVWALALATKEVTNWQSDGAEVGGFAIGPDGTLYVTTSQGSLVALDAKTMKPKDSYIAKGQAFTSAPVVFQYKDKTLIAAVSKDGQIHLLDSTALNAALNKTPAPPAASNFVPGALASWQGSDGTRWLLTSSAQAVVTWKVTDKDGAPALQTGWVSRQMTAPLTSMVIAGVVFTASGGDGPAVLYALDSTTGKELWNSGKTITSSARAGTLAAGGSQVYLATNDGTLMVFGYPIEH